MKVYIGNGNINDESFKSISDAQILNYIADDSECIVIVLDNILRNHKIADIPKILELCKTKLRLGGIIHIADMDFDILNYWYNMTNIEEFNSKVIQSGPLYSFLNIDFVKNICTNLGLTVTTAAINNTNFVIEVTRK